MHTNKTLKQTKTEGAYQRVKSWTRKMDIFSKHMLIFPICEDEHWYLILVCNPGSAASHTQNYMEEEIATENKIYPIPCLIVLDSLGGPQGQAVGKIRSYLQYEHLERKGDIGSFGKGKMISKNPTIPLQPNSCDCGVYLLHYVEKIFNDPEQFLKNNLPDLSQWFTSKEIDNKREEIALLIKRLAKENPEQDKEFDVKVEFPELQFSGIESKWGRRQRKLPEKNSNGLSDVSTIGNSDNAAKKKNVNFQQPLKNNVTPDRSSSFEPNFKYLVNREDQETDSSDHSSNDGKEKCMLFQTPPRKLSLHKQHTGQGPQTKNKTEHEQNTAYCKNFIYSGGFLEEMKKTGYTIPRKTGTNTQKLKTVKPMLDICSDKKERYMDNNNGSTSLNKTWSSGYDTSDNMAYFNPNSNPKLPARLVNAFGEYAEKINNTTMGGTSWKTVDISKKDSSYFPERSHIDKKFEKENDSQIGGDVNHVEIGTIKETSAVQTNEQIRRIESRNDHKFRLANWDKE